MDYNTIEELMEKAREAEGKTFGEIDTTNRLANAKSKGGLGQVIEEGFFGYEVNSNAEADFKHIGIELKVTPFKQNKNGSLSAKERLVLNIINYMEEVHTHFETSSFWKKNEKLLLMFYEWVSGVDRKDFHITKSLLFTYPEADLEIIKQDWETIVNKIRAGKAHELSEGDTNYLGACTKGLNKNSLRSQPYSEIQAMQRAFSLKPSYMTALVRRYHLNEKLVSFTTTNELKEKSLEEILYSKFENYIGLTDQEIAQKLSIEYKPTTKNFVPLLVSSLLGIKGTRLDKIEEFAKANIEFKTIRLEPNGKPEQNMSFETIDFHQWTNESWEESEIRERFYQTKFLFVIFEFNQTKKENPNRKLYFKGIKLWNMPVPTIEKEIRELWEEVNKVINEGIQIEYKKRGDKVVEANNLPKINFNGVAHIRPKARNGADKVALPDGQHITKQCYWLNNSYIAQIINKMDK
ncbi:Sau3AI family type II restriction endonuclease [Bacillus paranthracis]|uniref:Sau3AI family type II restriction endonuclease n=1 Tax=Bacillus cereus group TaxID=86661 RepID=UPI0022E0D36D|nr:MULTISPECIES: Sau3AI family type II restriction endonuclease [unclassified Bacillus cereus group]MDA1892728.1 Sau3AI family type II restriction endonuclease [Bacillus cereus group sp. BY11-1LC]MDA2591438.1 Sau3AI family type II restriction endonuclease [Bacillus cereus group sp. Bc065]